ncbi:MAG TPA: tRNA pseudouridine(55) synthase TruB [Vicinamibacterales bacterium]|nr:tRNA pseudouridine(55) synthase TruB [Vicinamibacterales bacterium]
MIDSSDFSTPSSAGACDGVLVIDKPRGLTSHDVVAAVRRALGERRAGHTGTLDPMATGVLPLLLGRATRLARFVTGADKTYEARVRFGWETDTDDATGVALTPPRSGAVEAAAVERALTAFRGTILQEPPRVSAKKVGGKRAYALARAASAPALAPVAVTIRRLHLLETTEDGTALLHVVCSAGCYMRALARDLGRALGTGAHLAALRRLASGRFTLADAVPLDVVLRDPAAARAAIRPSAQAVGDLPAVTLAGAALARARHGATVDVGRAPEAGPEGAVRILDPEGGLVGIARQGPRPGVLHPFVVLV